MPLVRFDLLKGREVSEIKEILQVTHETMVASFKVPARDRYQIVTQHEPYEMVIEDTGLGISRSERVLVVSLTSRSRTVNELKDFYQHLAENLAKAQLLEKNDLVVNVTVNDDQGWSFGNGEAQFIEGSL